MALVFASMRNIRLCPALRYTRPALAAVPNIGSNVRWFAAPKKKVTRSKRRIRMQHKWMKPDKSIYQCPTCFAFKKRHIALHCSEPAEDCGLKHDRYVFISTRNPTAIWRQCLSN